MTTTLVTHPKSIAAVQRGLGGPERRFAAGLVTVLTVLALAVHGYHPYAEDGGLYMAGIKRILDPAMYPHGTEFVVEHLRFSLFAPMVAGLVRASGLSVEMVLLLLHIASFWATLFAAWMLAERCYERRELRIGAVALLAAWLALPIAGTSLMLMDPYVTARSISTPCALLALVGALGFLLPCEGVSGKRWWGLALCCGALAIAAVMHPLMAAYALGCVLTLGCMLFSSRSSRAGAVVGLCVVGVATATALQTLALPEDGAYLRVALTRRYWFPSQWHWYELIGLVAPLVILSYVAMTRRREGDSARIALARMAVVAGSAAMIVATLFARIGVTTHLVARLQPLRVFQTIYIVMILAVGAAFAERVLQRRAIRWVTAFAALAAVMLFAERETFPASAHIELPTELRWSTPKNAWVRAFLWIRQNTPKDALLALDADYITKPGEDAQCFRAVAERSALPDYSKDGGEASITPALTDAWIAGQTAQTGLSTETDAQRIAALKPLGVDWVVLERSAATEFACDYANEAVKVCRLPQGAEQTAVASVR